jgi:hypothetical protein
MGIAIMVSKYLRKFVKLMRRYLKPDEANLAHPNHFRGLIMIIVTLEAGIQ